MQEQCDGGGGKQIEPKQGAALDLGRAPTQNDAADDASLSEGQCDAPAHARVAFGTPKKPLSVFVET